MHCKQQQAKERNIDSHVSSTFGPGGLPYKSNRGDRRKCWKETLKGTETSLCEGASNSF